MTTGTSDTSHRTLTDIRMYHTLTLVSRLLQPDQVEGLLRPSRLGPPSLGPRLTKGASHLNPTPSASPTQTGGDRAELPPIPRRGGGSGSTHRSGGGSLVDHEPGRWLTANLKRCRWSWICWETKSSFPFWKWSLVILGSVRWILSFVERLSDYWIYGAPQRR